jgi:predicted HTH domain antitoxin
MEVTIELPEDVAGVFLANGENIEREVLEATALEGYRSGKLSHAQIGRMLNLSRFEVDKFLKTHDVPLNYTVEDLEADRRTLDKLFAK